MRGIPVRLRTRQAVAFLGAFLVFLPLAQASQITVSAAISLKDSLVEIGKDYLADTKQIIRFNFGASGQLMAQIKEGAPVDVFISAAEKQVDELTRDGLVDPATRTIIAGNTLVLIVPADEAKQRATTRFADLAKPSIKRLAVGHPKTVPAGDYAMQVLASLQLDAALRDRIVYATHVRQVLDYVERGEVDAGIVYQSDALEAGDKIKTVATAEPAWHRPIRYVAVVVAKSAERDSANRFLKFLLEAEAQKELAARGFAPATQPTSRPAQASRGDKRLPD